MKNKSIFVRDSCRSIQANVLVVVLRAGGVVASGRSQGGGEREEGVKRRNLLIAQLVGWLAELKCCYSVILSK